MREFWSRLPSDGGMTCEKCSAGPDMLAGDGGGRGDGVLQMDQLSLLEHGGDRLGALHADIVAVEPAGERLGGSMSEVFMGAEHFWVLQGVQAKCRFGVAAHPSVDSWESLSTAAIALVPSTPMSLRSSLPASAEGRNV